MTEDKMNDDVLEEMARDCGSLIRCEHCYPLQRPCNKCEDIRVKRITDALKTLRSKTRKEDALIAKEHNCANKPFSKRMRRNLRNEHCGRDGDK